MLRCLKKQKGYNAGALVAKVLLTGAAALSTAICNPAFAQNAVTCGTPVTYEVHLRSFVNVPADWKPLKSLRVWHALPTLRPWSKGIPQTAGGSFDVRADEKGIIELEADKQASHVYYITNNVPAKSRFQFHTSFKVVSADRKLSAEAAKITWSDFKTKSLPIVKASPLDADTIKIVESIKAAQPDPVETLRALRKWIHENIDYDAQAPQKDTDVIATLTTKKGHCGHQSELFHSFAYQVGIPARKTFGLNLQSKETSVYKTGGQHTWCEVYFPKFGWIEVDAEEQAEDMFSIPAGYIQNNSAFQNFSEWVNASDGTPSCLRNNFVLAPKFQLQEFVQYRTF